MHGQNHIKKYTVYVTILIKVVHVTRTDVQGPSPGTCSHY